MLSRRYIVVVGIRRGYEGTGINGRGGGGGGEKFSFDLQYFTRD